MMRLDTKQLLDTLNNTTKYTEGFLEGIRSERVAFNRTLGQAMMEVLYEYIDSVAAMDPARLHHVYEPGQVGDPDARLFVFRVARVGPKTFSIDGDFLESKEITYRAKEPFYERARVMESGMSVSISPKYEKVLVFWPRQSLYVDEDDLVTGGGEGPVVTTGTIEVEHPGGPETTDGFKQTIDDFFNSYLTKAVLKPAMRRLATPAEFKLFYANGAKMGNSAGIKAGKNFMRRAANEPI